MESNFLKPISEKMFIDEASVPRQHENRNYMEYFQPYIDNIESYAIGPFYWFITDNSTMQLIAASENMNQHTPFSASDMNNPEINSGKDFSEIIHPVDRGYVLSATQYVFEQMGKMAPEKRAHVKFNIYGRFKNAQHIYRWVMVQFPAFYISDRVECQITLITDLSHLNLVGLPLLTVLDSSNTTHQFFKIMMETNKEIPISIPKITRREQDIIKLMAKGMKTPEIAKALCISYSTVENHRKNLRIKTNTKTSAELMNYIIYNSLI